MRRWGGILLAAMALLSAPALGVQCAIDQVPAATLLVPYFEVNLEAFEETTLVWITNTSSLAALGHVTLWTDWGIPALVFDIYFTGYDVQAFNLRDIVVTGLVPRTASTGQDFGGSGPAAISPKGPRSQDINYPSCNGILPPSQPALTAAMIAELQAKLTGRPIPSSGLCAGSPHGDNIARGYITVDVVTGCTLLNPSSPGYFSGVADDANVLTGEMLLVDTSTAVSFSYPVVHLEAATLPPGSRSFYGRFVGDSGADGREALPSRFAARFSRPVSSATDRLLVWRETGAETAPVSCGNEPAWAPLATNALTLVDELTNQAAAAPADLPVATGLLDVFDDVDNPFDHGLAILDLDWPIGARPAQAFVTSLREPSLSPEESFGVHQLEDACTGSSFDLLLSDGFENGFVPWSGKSPV